MKRSFKKMAVITLAGVLAAGSAFSAMAASIGQGQWCTGTEAKANDWWFKLDPEAKSFLANTWYWIKDTDGVIRCYYFDANGWMVKDQVVEGEQLDKDGHWVKGGVVQTRSESEDYVTAVTFEDPAKAASVVNAAATTTTVVNAGSGTKGPDAATNVPLVTSRKTGSAKGGGYKNPIKSSGQGDSPVNATFSQGYENSVLNGASATNNWANFTMNTGRTATLDNSGAGTDWYVTDGGAELICCYIPLDKYTAGNTSLDAFISSYLGDVRGYKGGSRGGSVTLGAYSYIQLNKVVKTPYGDMYDHAYVRQVEGTNYAQILIVEQNGYNEDFMSCLNTIARVR